MAKLLFELSLQEQAEYWEMAAKLVRGIAEKELRRAEQYEAIAEEYQVKIKEAEENLNLVRLIGELGEIYRLAVAAMVGKKWPGNDAQRELINYLAWRGKVTVENSIVKKKELIWEELLGKQAKSWNAGGYAGS